MEKIKKESEKSDEQKVEKTPEEKASDYFYIIHSLSRKIIILLKMSENPINEKKPHTMMKIHREIKVMTNHAESEIPVIEPRRYRYYENKMYEELSYENPNEKEPRYEKDEEKPDEQYKHIINIIQNCTVRLRVASDLMESFGNNNQWYAMAQINNELLLWFEDLKEQTKYDNEEDNIETEKEWENYISEKLGYEKPHKDIE